jgi:type VI secretion system protein
MRLLGRQIFCGRRGSLSLVAAAVAMMVVSGCSTGKRVRSMFGGLLPVQVQVAPDVNEDSPVAVDLLVIYDQKLADSLLKLPSTEWFSKRAQYVKDYPKELALQSWEWVPGQSVDPVTIAYHLGARKVILFADYRTDGEHRAAVEPQQPFRLVLGANDLTVEVPK